MAELLKQKDRTLAGMTAPAPGLYFVKVDYPHRFKLDIPMISPQFS
jgi:tRNA pseudouridine38-40 synthase